MSALQQGPEICDVVSAKLISTVIGLFVRFCNYESGAVASEVNF